MLSLRLCKYTSILSNNLKFNSQAVLERNNMTDSTATTSNPTLWLPADIWAMIVNLLSPNELIAFSLVSKTFHRTVTDDAILQPLYNRLYAMDKHLPAALPKEGAALAFKKAFEKIQARQQEEIDFLTALVPLVMAKPEYAQVLQENSSTLLESLEARNAVLNKINSEIVISQITNINSTSLHLVCLPITRLPVTLFQAEGYVNFWKNLTELSCAISLQLTQLDLQGLVALRNLSCISNKLTCLNLQGLMALETLDCGDNQLTQLNLQGLVALRELNCSHNQLTQFNLQGLMALETLVCDNNPLTDLNLTGVPAAIKIKHAELEKSLLFKQLSLSSSAEARQGIITRLGVNYTYKNCLYYCPVYAAKLFMTDSASQTYNLATSVLSHFSAYLPASSNARKRSRDEEQELDENQMDQEKEQNDEPEAKRSKKS